MLSAERDISSEKPILVVKPLLNLKEIEKINIHTNDVTLVRRGGGESYTMPKKQFVELGNAAWIDDLAPDNETTIEIDKDGDETVYTPGKQPKELTKYTTAQNFAQGLMNFIEAGALTYLIRQINGVCNVAKPYCDGSLGNFVLNGAILEILRELAEKEIPFLNYYRAQGNNKFWEGLIKIGTSNTAAYSLIILGSYFQANLQVKDNAMPFFSDIATNPEVTMPIIGAGGYFFNKLVHWASKKAWEEWIPCHNPNETIVVNPDLTLLQLLGQFQLRWVKDVAITEALLFFIATFGSQALGADPRFQMSLLIGTDVTRLMANYFIFTPSPVKQIIHSRVAKNIEGGQGEEDGHHHTFSKVMCTRTAITVGCSVGSFVINEISLLIYPANSFATRMARDAIALGTPLLVSYAAEKVVPRVRHWWNMFRHPVNEEQQQASIKIDESTALIPHKI